jgi:hypothetical protein
MATFHCTPFRTWHALFRVYLFTLIIILGLSNCKQKLRGVRPENRYCALTSLRLVILLTNDVGYQFESEYGGSLIGNTATLPCSFEGDMKALGTGGRGNWPRGYG